MGGSRIVYRMAGGLLVGACVWEDPAAHTILEMYIRKPKAPDVRAEATNLQSTNGSSAVDVNFFTAARASSSSRLLYAMVNHERVDFAKTTSGRLMVARSSIFQGSSVRTSHSHQVHCWLRSLMSSMHDPYPLSLQECNLGACSLAMHLRIAGCAAISMSLSEVWSKVGHLLRPHATPSLILLSLPSVVTRSTTLP